MPRPDAETSSSSMLVLPKAELGAVIRRLWDEGYTVVGPILAQGAIVIDELRTADQLPIGWTEEQERGTYRLKKRGDRAYFGFTVGPHSWKKYLFPPKLTLFTLEWGNDALAVHPSPEPVPRYAFIGVRSCDLHAIEVQDRTFLHGPYPDPHYKARRDHALIIAVNCAQAAPTCFCASMGTGPRVDRGFDLALTELADVFVAEIGSDRGRALLDGLSARIAGPDELDAARRVVEETAGQMVRKLDASDMPGLLYENLEHPRWDDVAERCLSCTNCTMVCPTCFCHATEEVPDLAGGRSERVRQWDSCFNPEFGHVAGGNSRPEIRARYRQWLTHKLASWIDQYGVSGCVGCGRCITWCPVGIDITEEVAAIRGSAEA